MMPGIKSPAFLVWVWFVHVAVQQKTVSLRYVPA